MIAAYCGKQCQRRALPTHKEACLGFARIQSVWDEALAAKEIVEARVFPLLHDRIRGLTFGAADGTHVARHALDLGCGIGVTASYLVKRGWRVTRVEKGEQSLRALRDKMQGVDDVVIVDRDITQLDVMPAASLVVINDVMPYIRPSHFLPLLQRVHRAVQPGGHVFITMFLRAFHAGAWSLETAQDHLDILRCLPFDVVEHRRRPKMNRSSNVWEFHLRKPDSQHVERPAALAERDR